ncbi:hypothetical protein [Deinococcus sonorensis]|uniref:Uncharacterized protein n=1 Tax=Deinococcus sonorensis TaxID=309891 RepID=A0ABV8YAF4_9DEIO
MPGKPRRPPPLPSPPTPEEVISWFTHTPSIHSLTVQPDPFALRLGGAVARLSAARPEPGALPPLASLPLLP